MHRFSLFTVIVCCPGLLIAGTEAPLIESGIESVVTGGFWQSGDVSGRYRVVVVNSGFEQVHSDVFLEWIQDGSESSGPCVLCSVPVAQVNESGAWSIGVPEFSFGMEGIRLLAVNSFTLESRVFILTPLPGGEYLFSEEQSPE